MSPTFGKNMDLAFAASAKLLITLSADMSILLATITLDVGHISVLRFVLCNICSSYWIAGNSLLNSSLSCMTLFLTKELT